MRFIFMVMLAAISAGAMAATTAPSDPSIQTLFASPSYVSFYNVPVGFSRSSSVYVRNNGPEAVQVSVNSGCFGDIHAMSFCNLTLNPGQQCSISIEFRPNRVGSQSCSLNINDYHGGYASVQVSGQGVAR
jgi:hypothetical protein